MNDCVYGIKILSNMIVVRFAENDIFMNILKTHIAKNFSSVMNLRQSTFIFYRDGEDLRRRIFLNWMHNLYLKSGTQIDKQMFEKLLTNQKLTICMQVVPKSKLVETIKLFAYFLDSKILFRTSEHSSPFYAYLKSSFRNHKVQIKQNGGNLHIDMKGLGSLSAQRLRRVLLQKLTLAGRNYTLLYNQKDFDSYFARFISTEKQERTSSNRYNRNSSYQNNSNNHKNSTDELETLSDAQRMARYLRILGCSENEDISTIKRRFFSLAKEYHPDMHHGKEESTLKFFTEKFIQIKDAYDFLV